ncbi:MAG: NAD(P)/FAD-dependent oxidoreductase [Aeromonas sp.]
MQKIVIVGGGAGGLELATRLGDKLGQRGRAQVTLIDRNAAHIWKPQLHELATGLIDFGHEGLSYHAHAKAHHLQFQQGTLCALDRQHKRLMLSAILDEQGGELIPARQLAYDYLVMAVGSVSNDFAIDGVSRHCSYLDSPQQAQRFQQRLLATLYQQAFAPAAKAPHIAVVGGGATGVELCAALLHAVQLLPVYGVGRGELPRLEVSLIEAGARILPALPERISAAAAAELHKLGVQVRTQTAVSAARAGQLVLSSGEIVAADLMVWAAGIKAPAFLATLDGLETNRLAQLQVTATLQSTRDETIYALGDCAACLQADGRPVPPRAQAAHQMASHVYKNLIAQLNGKPLTAYRYQDYGSLISLSHFAAVGHLMGGLNKGSLQIEGRLARWAYISLYRLHQISLHGVLKTGLLWLAGQMNRFVRPQLKLH